MWLFSREVETLLTPRVQLCNSSMSDVGITATPYLLHRFLESRTMSVWHASAVSSLRDFRTM